LPFSTTCTYGVGLSVRTADSGTASVASRAEGQRALGEQPLAQAVVSPSDR